MNNLQKIMRIAQEGGFASDEETLDPCTYRLVHMFRTMLNSKIQAGVPFNVAVLELSNTINIRQLTINNLLSEYSPEELSAIDIDLYSDWIILQAGSKIKEADPVSMFTANLLRKMFLITNNYEFSRFSFLQQASLPL